MNVWVILMVIGGVLGYAVDFYESLVLRPQARRQEGNKIFRNPDGTLNWKRALIIHPLVYFGGGTVLYFLCNLADTPEQDYNVGAYAFGAWVLGAGIVHAVMGIHNILKNKKVLANPQPPQVYL